MQFSVATVLALATAVSAGISNVTYTTEVVTALTTYCPEATTLTHNGKTYTVSEATTLTITDCPCTLTKPVTTATTVSCSTTPYSNATISYTATKATIAPSAKPSSVVTSGAGKGALLSGAAGAIALGAALLL
ncbi:hypothetical protein SPI_00316 [Niveomyces insectorum RCEF 264]|uniref:Clock-controlled protein 6 n=1 Tax=Niveomyces insectorum RCEF 264 TaxID=1081102 RepID=A0A168A179_9HYPO|nr:hypothetical protein SPI_00316 [Niveomyces insectorum RCEF 264]